MIGCQLSKHGGGGRGHGLANRALPKLGNERRSPQSSPRAPADSWFLPPSRPNAEGLLRRQWTRPSPRNSSASCSRTERRNALPAELAQPSQLPAHRKCNNGAGKLHDWVRGRRRERADGRRGRTPSRMRGLRSLKDTQWSRQTCCGVGESGRVESRCCCATL